MSHSLNHPRNDFFRQRQNPFAIKVLYLLLQGAVFTTLKLHALYRARLGAKSRDTNASTLTKYQLSII
uniref:Uncharacterized protein n=1 Tax=Glossina palpalis gambiensis TaxID=67801 RepID=A0A1B0BES6_9MUSC